MADNNSALMGWASLAGGLLGLFLPATAPAWLFFAIEGAALACGVVARKSRIGKVGIVACSLFLLLALLPIFLTRIYQPADYRKIELGMSAEEVENVLGGPAGDYRSPGRIYDFGYGYPEGCASAEARQWERDEGVIVVFFDKQGKVVGKLFVLAESTWVWWLRQLWYLVRG